MPPSGDDPSGGDDTNGSDSPGEYPETTKAVLRAIAAVEDRETRTRVTVKKFCCMLGRELGVDPFRLYTIYVWGFDSIDVDVALHELEDDGLIETRPSQHPRVNTDVFLLTEKGEELLNELPSQPDFDELYDWFRTRFGLSGSWDKYKRMVCSWLSHEPNYVGTNGQLFDALTRKAAVSDEFDPLFESCLDAGDPTFLTCFDEDTAKVAKLAHHLVENKKFVPDPSDEDPPEHKFRFSTRNICDYLDDGPVDPEDRVVLLRGYAESIQHLGRIFYLKEDRIETSPSIRIEFFGEWDEPPEEILNRHSIGVLGYVTESDEEPVVRALAIIKAPELPEDLSTGNPTSTSDESHGTSATWKQTSLDEYVTQDENVKSLIENQREFLENCDDDVEKECKGPDEFLDQFLAFLQSNSPADLEDEELERRLEELKAKFRERSDDLERIALWLTILRWLWNQGGGGPF